MGLWYSKDFGFELTTFSDADHAGCFDTRKSTSGGIQFLESKDLTSLSLDGLIGNLKVHEMIIKKDSEIVKATGERKSLDLKAKKNLVMRSVRLPEVKTKNTPWRSETSRSSSREESDSGEEDDEKAKDETCLVAQASNEVCFDSSYFSDENSSIDDLTLDNEYDKLCKMSLKIITKNKRLKAIRNSLENELSELKLKLSTLEKNKGVDLECTNCQSFKIENEKLNEGALKLTKFEKSTHFLNEMLSNQKPSDDKLGLRFNSCEALTSKSKEIKFVKSQKETSSGGGQINVNTEPASLPSSLAGWMANPSAVSHPSEVEKACLEFPSEKKLKARFSNPSNADEFNDVQHDRVDGIADTRLAQFVIGEAGSEDGNETTPDNFCKLVAHIAYLLELDPFVMQEESPDNLLFGETGMDFSAPRKAQEALITETDIELNPEQVNQEAEQIISDGDKADPKLSHEQAIQEVETKQIIRVVKSRTGQTCCTTKCSNWSSPKKREFDTSDVVAIPAGDGQEELVVVVFFDAENKDNQFDEVKRMKTKLNVTGNTTVTGDGGSNGTFFRAVLLVQRGNYDEAREYVETTTKCLATDLAAFVSLLYPTSGETGTPNEARGKDNGENILQVHQRRTIFIWDGHSQMLFAGGTEGAGFNKVQNLYSPLQYYTDAIGHLAINVEDDLKGFVLTKEDWGNLMLYDEFEPSCQKQRRTIQRILQSRNIRLRKKLPVIRHLKDLVANVNDKSREPYNAIDVTALIEQNDGDRVELEKVKRHYKELYDSIKITHAHTSEKTSTMLNEIESLKAQLRSKEPCFTSDYVKPKVLAPGMYAIDVKPTLKNNRSAHLNYISHLKESVETVREIVEEARVVKPLDNSLNYACQYTKLSQELLEYVIGTCPKSFNERDNKAPSTPVTRKKQVTFSDKPGTSSSNTQKHKVHQRVQQTNIPVIPSTGVNDSTEASGSKPRSNTKKNRILPAKKENKKEVEVRLRTNKSVWTKVNRVDSSISSKRVVINSNSESVCKTCNKCVNSASHGMCVVNILNSVNATPTVRIVLNKKKQIWKPKGKLSDNSLNKTKQIWKPKGKLSDNSLYKTKRVWKATGKLFADIGYQWRPTGKKLTLGKLDCGSQWRPTGKKFALGEMCHLTKLSVKCSTLYANQQVMLWYLDSGCSKHMTGNRSKLMNFVEKFIGSVRFGNDHLGAIMGYGDYVMGDSVISRVYYVEGLGHNLFSVGQFCDSDLEVAFRKHTCFVRDIKGTDILKGSRGTNLYTISIDEMMKSSPICLLSKASKSKSWLWHRRLNHLNFGTINDLARKDLVRGLPRLKFEKDHLCSACQLGKSKKFSHRPKSENTNMEVLHTLHMDLCGPMRVQSIKGKKYILVIVDDYSRFTWVKFLRSKDETPEFVTNFLKQIQVGLNKTVRFIRTDNGTEFVNQVMSEYYEGVGIFHQKSVPRTPQQNGVVERRNRTLVEAARTMMIFSKAPMFLWAEAVATACYTQNRSLIHTRHNKTPYELVHDKKPDLTFFRVFGALCYPTNDSESLGKFQAKADIGIFVGYAPSRKGYRIYNKRTRRLMETIHVTFDEMHQSMAPIRLSSGSEPFIMTPGLLKSGLAPTDKELEMLFQPMFDEHLEQLRSMNQYLCY
ncbi:retrovirus-related pol polyprotein from transposon TNT 1-94 [Tanacetum coccineum]